MVSSEFTFGDPLDTLAFIVDVVGRDPVEYLTYSDP